tara:strand:- start:15488 stop:15760 length:273 start_codon:yes stop_codon:yes gene_type:complete
MSKIIKLTQGKTAIIDEDDYDRIVKYKWFASIGGKTTYYYAATNLYPGKQIKMHRFIMNVNAKDIIVDHINHDTLDNRKINYKILYSYSH